MTGFRGSYTVMVTPFDEAGRLDEPALRRFVDWQIAEGTYGLIPLGSTGEFLSLTREERRAVVATIADRNVAQVSAQIAMPMLALTAALLLTTYYPPLVTWLASTLAP